MIDDIIQKYFSQFPNITSNYILVILIILLVVILLGWILTALALSKMNRALNQKNSWMGWVPILNTYLLGSVAYTKPLGILMTLLLLLSGTTTVSINNNVIMTSGLIPSPYNTIIVILFTFLALISVFKIYRMFSTKAWIMIIFTIITFGLLAPIFMFCIRKNAVIESNVNYSTE